jgi:hypothetical protein
MLIHGLEFSLFDLFALKFFGGFTLPSTMLPTTCAKTAKATETQLKQAAVAHDHLQKVNMLKAVNNAVLEYSTSTGKKKVTALQELFTIEHLSQKKCALSARDMFLRDKMQEINKGTLSFCPHCAGISLS